MHSILQKKYHFFSSNIAKITKIGYFNAMPSHFTKQTFAYFDGAKKNKNNEKWFLKNRNLYLEHVREPFGHLISVLHTEFSRDLPRIRIEPKQITRPLRTKNRAQEGGLIKTHTHLSLWEKKTSLFEWNPGLHLQFGAEKDDNFFGLGLYMVSSRQLSRLRRALVDDFDQIDALLQDRKLKKAWGGLLGEKYKRFPKGFDPADRSEKYLWYKQFYLGQNLTRKEVLEKSLVKKITKDLRLAMPFFKWVRETVGTYSR